MHGRKEVLNDHLMHCYLHEREVESEFFFDWIKEFIGERNDEREMKTCCYCMTGIDFISSTVH